MPQPPIPLLEVAGNARDVGRQLGAACRSTIRRAAGFDDDVAPLDRTRAEQLALADAYAAATRPHLPWVFDELDGMAEAADVDPRALWACLVEEIWYAPRGRCTDLVAAPPATADGHVLTAHNNDMPAQYMADLVAVVRRVEGQPAIFSIGNGIWISAGWNAAGLNLTGNELAPNDERVGIPREVQVRAMLAERTLDGMLAVALHPARASSYNNVLADAGGRVANVEGSATAAAVTEPDERGHLVHANHYVCDAMLGYEGDQAYAERSATRHRRAAELLGAAAAGSVTVDALRAMLSDHANAPDALCRHARPEGGSVTAFWSIADMQAGRVVFGRGNPCDSVAQEQRFA